MPEDKIISHAKVGIIGGGIMGVSLLYHLAKEGWKDLVFGRKRRIDFWVNLACGWSMSTNDGKL